MNPLPYPDQYCPSKPPLHYHFWPFIIGVMAVVVIANAVIITRYSFADTNQAQGPLNEQALLTAIQRHVSIDTNEKPRIMTISNLEQVKAENPAFYKDAHLGDRVLFWDDKVILYSEVQDRVLVVLPISSSLVTN